MFGGNLIAEGGYGCIYYPSLNEYGEEENTNNFVSKLQLINYSALNEINIGNIIKNITGYINHFAPVIDNNNINQKKVNFNAINKCSIIKSKKKKDKMIILKMDYIEGTTFDQHIIDEKNNRELIFNVINSFVHLTKGISILIDNNIIHFDIKEDNIMFNNKKKVPILIDFGLSMKINNIDNLSNNNELLQKYFYIFAPQYYIWPIEIHFLSYLINVKSNISNDDIIDIVNKCIKNNPIFSYFSSDFVIKYKNLCIQQLKYYNLFEKNKKIRKILTFWKTWDSYSLSIMFLRIICLLNYDGFKENIFTTFFSEILTKNIHPDPTKRYSIDETKFKFSKFLYDKNINNIVSFKEVVKLFQKNKKSINKELLLNKEKYKTLNKLIKK
tara:strand:- start:3097 stop:4251 length:1155 start_codon:yes stop_codon:yes gene_type:complete